MNTIQKPKERGQALALIVMTMVALLGFTALAVDGGMVYSDRRHAQNGADAASLAGAGAAALALDDAHVTYGQWGCGGAGIVAAQTAAREAAKSRASDNGYVIDENIDDNNGVTANCDQYDNGSWIERFIDIKVMITRDTPTSFAHFVFGDDLKNTVEAVARVRPRSAMAFGHAIVALNETQDCNGNQNGVIFSGNTSVNVNGGGVFSNGCLSGNGASLDVNVTNGSIVHVGELETNHPSTFDPAPESGDGITLPDYAVLHKAPDCSLVANYGSPDNSFKNHASGYIPAGNYTSIKMNGAVTLQGGGLYCMHGNFAMGNNDVSIDNPSQGVTIYLISGSITSDGGGDVQLFAPPAGAPPPPMPGMLIYLAWGNTGLVRLRGNTTSIYVGTVFAPDGRIDIAGDASVSSAEFNTQLIAKDVEIGGNAYININFDEDDVATMPASLELNK
ncbi:MAG: Tad domain-containing protein [Anaerolineales bacterium]|nr:Tad domain-containing protein [Anaerolineales bacterium]